MDRKDTLDQRAQAAAYGGLGWSPRRLSMQDEIGTLWASCGVNCEWSRLRSVLLYRPGPELEQVRDPNDSQFLERPDATLARKQHDAIGQAYAAMDVHVQSVQPSGLAPPNLMFIADLIFMTPEGAIVARPASTIRAGEERFVAETVAAMGIPILRTIRGTGTFEGADAAWLTPQTVLLGVGLRTNHEGADQVTTVLEEMGVNVIRTDLEAGSMHLMGCLRFADCDLAVTWPGQTPDQAVKALRDHGFETLAMPDMGEIIKGQALNFVTLGPRRILMSAGNPRTMRAFEKAGIECLTVDISELGKAAGGIGCLTGVLEREQPG